MENIKEEQSFNPTIKQPVSDLAKGFQKNFNKTMRQDNINLNETDTLLTEKEHSLKKKIFSLAKMEALVFSDPKLSTVYDEMSENGEEKYGYHYNETIMNMLFNDYVLNSPRYLQKYRMAIPQKKKRRDKSGINQLKKAGHKKPVNPIQTTPATTEIGEGADDDISKVMFLVNETEPNSDVFAYFPEERYNDKYMSGYSHVGQHTGVHPDYAAESREATPEEYQDLKAELEGIGYNLQVLNHTNEETGAASSGAFAPALGYKTPVAETTSSSSSGAYEGPAAWGGGDLMKGGKSKAMTKPIWVGGAIIQESNYLTDPLAFAKYVDMLNEEVEINPSTKEIPIDAARTQPDIEQMPNQKPYTNAAVNNKIIDKTAAFSSDTVKNWNKPDTALELHTLQNGTMDEPSQGIEEGVDNNLIDYDIPEWAITALINGDYSGLEDEDEQKLNQFIQKVTNQFGNAHFMLGDIDGEDNLGFRHTNDIDNLGNNVYRLYIRPSKVSKPVDDTTASDRMYNSDAWVQAQRDAEGLDEKSTSPAQQRLFGMAHAAQKGEIPISKLGGAAKKIATTVNPKDVTDFASTKYDEMNEEGGEWEARQDLQQLQRDGAESVLNANKYIPILKKLVSTSKSKDDLVRIVGQYLREKGITDSDLYQSVIDKAIQMSQEVGGQIGETMQSIIDDKPDTVAKGTPTGTVSTGNVPVGLVDMKEEMNILNEITNELNTYSIYHNKLKQMAEDRKPSALVLKDRLGAENAANFKKDFNNSDTKEIIDIEKELQWKDEQTEIGDNPYKLGEDIENNELSTTKGVAFKNVGNSTNNDGDEVPKRNITTEEQDEVNLYRKALHSYNFDRKPDQRFEDRMKADMGKEVYEIREKQMAEFGKAPMYNKEAQPTQPTKANRKEFDKEKSGWNNPNGLKESMISGRYRNALDKSHIIDFVLNEVKMLKQTSEKTLETLFPLDFTGLGNSFNAKSVDYKVSVNESVINMLDAHKFYTDGKQVFAIKNPKQNLSEADNKTKPILNEEMEKMKHLLDYKPNSFVSTDKTKKNRGF
jgi:hypothetical protein